MTDDSQQPEEIDDDWQQAPPSAPTVADPDLMLEIEEAELGPAVDV